MKNPENQHQQTLIRPAVKTLEKDTMQASLENQSSETRAVPEPGPVNPAPLKSPEIHLIPVEGSEKPVMSNYAAFEVTPGIVYINFGFIEPAVIGALERAAQTGAPLPEQISGRMAVRVAVGVDVLQNLHQQMGQVLTALLENAQQQLSSLAQLAQGQEGQAANGAQTPVPPHG
jgi:hypothetical protein